MSAPRGNLIAVTAGRLLVALSSFVVNVAVARALPREDFGTYRWVWSVVTVFAFAADLGLFQLVNRQVALDHDSAPRRVAVGLQATGGLSVLTTLAICAYVAVVDGRVEVVVASALAALSVTLIAGARHVQAGFYGLRRMFLEMPSLVASRAVFVVTSLAVVGFGGDLVALYVARLVSSVVLLAWVIRTFRVAVGPLDLRLDTGELKGFVAQGRTFGASVLFGTVIAQADVLMLQLARSEDEVARYAAPASLLLQLATVPTILSIGLFPRLTRLGAGDPALRSELAFQTRMMLASSLPIAVGGVVVAGDLLAWMFGEAYRDTALPAVALLLTVPLRFLHNGYGMALTAVDRQSLRARSGAVAAGVNVVANLVAIPLLGAEGAALTTFLTDLALLFGLWLAVRDQLDGPAERDALVRTLVPALVMGAVVLVLPPLHVLVRIAVGAAVYLPLVVLAGGLKRADLGHLHRV